MASLKGLFESAQRGEQLYVTKYHAEWLELPPDEQVYTPEAAEHARAVLMGEKKHPRPGRFSPSSLGMCRRRLMFGFEGAPQVGENLDSLDLMNVGTFDHLKWQVEGISYGYMKEGEVWVHDPDLRLGGSMDGLLADDSGFELKTARSTLYNKYVVNEKAPKHEHTLQFGAYAMIHGLTWGSIVYEHRDSGQFHEFRIDMTGPLEKAVLNEVKVLNSRLEEGKLPPILDDCEMRLGYTYNSCPYRKECLSRHKAFDEDIKFPEVP